MEVYVIRNCVNNKVYIGQTIKTKEQRFKEHISTSTNTKYKHPLYDSIRKYGVNSFRVETLKTCDSIEELNYWEERLIREFNSLHPNGYNLLPGGNNKRQNIFSINKIKEKHRTVEAVEKQRQIALSEWKNPEYIQKQLNSRRNVYTDNWKNNVKIKTKEAMYTTDVRIRYLRNYIQSLMSRNRNYINLLFKLLEVDAEFKSHCSAAFNN